MMLSVLPMLLASLQVAAAPVSVAFSQDTGDFKSTPRDFTSYTDPRMCLAAAREMHTVLDNSLTARVVRNPLLSIPVGSDSLPTAVVAAARSCGARLTLSATAAKDLPPLFDVALLEMNDALARDVLARLGAAVTTDTGRQALLLHYMGLYLAAAPARITAAESIADTLDAAQHSSLDVKLQAHEALLNFAAARFDRRLMRQQAERIIALIQGVPSQAPPKNVLESLRQAYGVLIGLAWMDAPDSMPVIARQIQESPAGRQMMASFHPSKAVSPRGTAARGASDSLDAIIRLVQPHWMTQIQSQPTPPVQSDFQFPDSSGNVTPSHNGQVTLFVHYSFEECQPFYKECGQVIHLVRQLRETFGVHQLAIVLVVAAHRWTAQGDDLRPPAEVAASYARWLHDNLHLSAAVAVQMDTTVKLRLPAPDGRVFYDGTPRDIYGSHAIVMTDRGGHQIVYAIRDVGGIWNPGNTVKEAAWSVGPPVDLLIARELHESASEQPAP